MGCLRVFKCQSAWSVLERVKRVQLVLKLIWQRAPSGSPSLRRIFITCASRRWTKRFCLEWEGFTLPGTRESRRGACRVKGLPPVLPFIRSAHTVKHTPSWAFWDTLKTWRWMRNGPPSPSHSPGKSEEQGSLFPHRANLGQRVEVMGPNILTSQEMGTRGQAGRWNRTLLQRPKKQMMRACAAEGEWDPRNTRLVLSTNRWL